VNALRPLTFAALDLLYLIGGVNYSQRRLDLVARIGNKALLLAVALDHRSNHRARGTRHNCQHRQPANVTDRHARAQKRMKACKLARAVHEHIGDLVVLDVGRITIIAREARGPALGMQPCGNTGGALGTNRGNAGRIDIGNLSGVNRHRKVARVEGRLRRHAFEVSDANARLAIAGILAISGLGFRLVPPIDTVLARQNIVQASVGHLADMRIIDDVDAGDDEREHHGHGAHGNEDKLATQTAAQYVNRISPPLTTRGGVKPLRHALAPRARAHAYSPSSTTSSE